MCSHVQEFELCDNKALAQWKLCGFSHCLAESWLEPFFKGIIILSISMMFSQKMLKVISLSLEKNT